MEELFNWESIKDSKALQQLREDWHNLLNDATQKEIKYHNFIASNPYFFIAFFDSYLSISKFKLGNYYETDFVVVREGYSDGTIYELIEIESPHIKLFDKKGNPTKSFNNAIQQILDWKRFLSTNSDFIKKNLPTTSTRLTGESRIRFKILIGRRLENKDDIDKRQQYSELHNIEIISYDRVTDFLELHKGFHNHPMIYSGQMSSLRNPAKKNELANPFFECISDSTWRKICKAGHTNHFHTNFLDEILSNRTYSKYFEIFKKETQKIQGEDF